MRLLIAWVINSLTLLAASFIVPGFKVASIESALLASIVIGLINIFIRPFLILITLPLNIMTIGLFTFVVNAIVLWLASFVVAGLTIETALAGILAAIVISVVSTILSHLVKDFKLG